MLNCHRGRYGTVLAHGDQVLEIWHRETHLLFSAVEKIMSNRSIFIRAYDGEFKLTEVNALTRIAKYPTKGMYYRLKEVLMVAAKLSSYSLVYVIPRVLDESFRDVGRASKEKTEEHHSAVGLLPRIFTKALIDRIFVQLSESDDLLLELVPWMKTALQPFPTKPGV